jgi:NAD(P)-dependent dehydrogenase (short-subunit alcohol dehydrogenase family)
MSESANINFGRVAVVTGAGRGIGLAVVQLLDANGWVVFCCGRTEPALLPWISRCQRVHYLSVDLATEQGCEAMVQFVRQGTNKVDMLVHNAGAFVTDTVLNAPEKQLEDLMALNVYSAYRLSRTLHALLCKSSRPYVFTLCSVASLKAYPGGASYCISKFALLALTKMLRVEWLSDGIAVSAILPGAVYTDSWAGNPWPEERLMPPADVAEAILHAYRASPRTVFEEILLRPMQGDL